TKKMRAQARYTHKPARHAHETNSETANRSGRPSSLMPEVVTIWHGRCKPPLRRLVHWLPSGVHVTFLQ
ncbi:MAG: hypothetical protein K9G30_08070, partial [Parvibaculum sp.]|nr:hypothetical protein [Parvibaculum sp.]